MVVEQPVVRTVLTTRLLRTSGLLLARTTPWSPSPNPVLQAARTLWRNEVLPAIEANRRKRGRDLRLRMKKEPVERDEEEPVECSFSAHSQSKEEEKLKNYVNARS